MGSRSLWARHSLCKSMIAIMSYLLTRLFKYAAHYCWRGSGREQAMAMYYALLRLGAQDDDFACRTDEIGK